MGKYKWHGNMWSATGCPGEFYSPGWYTVLGAIGGTPKFIVKDYRNPSTGKPYTDAELDKIQGVVVPPIVIPVKPTSSGSTWIVVGIGLIVVMAIVAFVMLK